MNCREEGGCSVERMRWEGLGCWLLGGGPRGTQPREGLRFSLEKIAWIQVLLSRKIDSEHGRCTGLVWEIKTWVRAQPGGADLSSRPPGKLKQEIESNLVTSGPHIK